MSDQFHTSVHATNEGIALAHTLHGQPTESHERIEQTGNANIARATWSTAPYVPPGRRHRDNPNLTLCALDGCRAYPTKGFPYCAGHARSQGLAPTCAKSDCNAAPRGDDRYCRHHQLESVEELPDADAE